MRTLHHFLFLMCLLLIGGTGEPRAGAVPAKLRYEPEQRERPLLEGLWRQVHVEFEGADQNENEGPTKNRWQITADKITIITRGPKGDQDSGSWTYRFDLTKSPVALDLTPIGYKAPYPCILKLEGNRLMVCLQNFPERGRPTDFVSRPNS